jgi:hypothetical protein
MKEFPPRGAYKSQGQLIFFAVFRYTKRWLELASEEYIGSKLERLVRASIRCELEQFLPPHISQKRLCRPY